MIHVGGYWSAVRVYKEKENQRADIRKMNIRHGLTVFSSYSVFLVSAPCATKKGTNHDLALKYIRPQMEKQVNLTLIGIATDAVERNPRENTDAIPLNRTIDRFIAFSRVTSSRAVAFPSSHSYTGRGEKVFGQSSV